MKGVLYGILASMFVALSATYIKLTLKLVDNSILWLTYFKNLNALVLFLPIMLINGELVKLPDFEYITSKNGFYGSNESDIIRLNAIYNYTLSHYKRDIKLKEVAAVSYLSITSFCRYFKLMTRKTYYDFLIEIRVSHACRYLIEDNLPTSAICFECGFNNISNFYRHFKRVKGITPLEFKRKYLDREIIKSSAA